MAKAVASYISGLCLTKNGNSFGSGPRKGSEKETNSYACFPCRFKITATPFSLVDILET